jgi:selenocysteine lyase/cysteine desulfurase
MAWHSSSSSGACAPAHVLSLLLLLRSYILQVSMSGAGSSRLDFTARGLQEVLRASVAYYNSEGELEALVQALQELVNSSAAE